MHLLVIVVSLNFKLFFFLTPHLFVDLGDLRLTCLLLIIYIKYFYFYRHHYISSVLLFQLLLCMLAFVVPSLQAALISLFPRFSLEIRYIFFLVVYIIPRFMSPVIYGFRDEQFRKYWTRYLACRSQRIIRVRPVLLKGNLSSNWQSVNVTSYWLDKCWSYW